MEQVYELNLPPFKDVVRNDFAGFRNTNLQYDYLTKTDVGCEKILKSEYLNLLDFNWSSYRYFKKSNVTGGIHTDLDSITDKDTQCRWGINWIFNGSGTIEFWNFENVKHVGRTTGALNDPTKGKAPKFIPLSSPDYVYDNLENHVYLINATLPHRAVGGPNRCCFSLRVLRNNNYNWEQIVNKFNKLIK